MRILIFPETTATTMAEFMKIDFDKFCEREKKEWWRGERRCDAKKRRTFFTSPFPVCSVFAIPSKCNLRASRGRTWEFKAVTAEIGNWGGKCRLEWNFHFASSISSDNNSNIMAHGGKWEKSRVIFHFPLSYRSLNVHDCMKLHFRKSIYFTFAWKTLIGDDKAQRTWPLGWESAVESRLMLWGWLWLMADFLISSLYSLKVRFAMILCARKPKSVKAITMLTRSIVRWNEDKSFPSSIFYHLCQFSG